MKQIKRNTITKIITILIILFLLQLNTITSLATNETEKELINKEEVIQEQKTNEPEPISNEPIAISNTNLNGTYTIKSAINQNYVLDVESGSKQNQANIQLYQNNNTNAQKWQIERIDGEYYKITSINSNKVIDVSGASKQPGTNVWQYDFNNTNAQKWQIKNNGDGTYSFVSKGTGLYLDINSGIAKNNANVQTYTGNGSKAQKFILEKTNKAPESNTPNITVADGTYKIRSVININYVLDVESGSKQNQANIQLYQNNNTNAQKWQIERIDGEYYKITSINSNKVIDVSGASKQPGTNVWQYDFNNTNAQKWQIKNNGDGTYSFVSKGTGLYLDINSGIAKNNANVQTYTGNGSKAQKFLLEKTTYTASGENNQSGGNNINPQSASERPIADGTYMIESAVSNKAVLNICGGSKDNGANIQIFEKQPIASEKFKVQYLQDGYYKISSTYTDKVLDVYGSFKESGTNVWLYEFNNTDAQKWQIKNNGDGTYSIISKCNGLNLDLSGGLTNNGSNIHVYQGNNTIAQKFRFVQPIIGPVDTLDTSKYPGYKEKLQSIMNNHPGWNIEFIDTGLTFSEVIQGETALHARNLVPVTVKGEYICSVCGTKRYDNGTWYCASDRAVGYYMDPRNFLDDSNIFQFLDLNEYVPDSCSLQGIQNKVNNTFLQNYATSVNDACRNQGVNPYFITARVLQEQGSKGTEIGKGMNGKDGKTYYNPFNIGATGNSYDEIKGNALNYASSAGWDTMQKGLEGGITFLKNNWLNIYQNTLYQNKFDIDKRSGSSLYTHQYMQNLMAAYSEAGIMKSMYTNTGKTESNFTFIIPLYKDINKVTYSESKPSIAQETGPMNFKVTANPTLMLRESADTNSKVLKEVPNGEIILSVKRGINSNWHQVMTTDGTIGYMSGQYLTQVNDVTNCNEKAKVATNDGSGCYIRIGPSCDIDKITALSDGTEVTIIDKGRYNNITGYDWCRIKLSNGTQAFMPIKYLK